MTITQQTDYDLARLDDAFAAFRAAHPEFDNAELEKLRASEYSRLDRLNHIYLDYTGGGLYSETQLRQHQSLLLEGVYGNPHSGNPTSLAMTRLDEDARRYIFQFFNADPAEYVVIFTSNASGALKHVGESYPFEPGANYLLTFDNHNSVNGIREFARAKGATVMYSPVVPPDLRIDETRLRENLDRANPNSHNLFAYPAQSNFSGVQHSLEWIEIARAKGWDVLVDCAAFAPTNYLDLSQWKPDFISLSFYKIFGYPTGVGALIARRPALQKLRRPWFAGGTIHVASVQAGNHYLADGEAAFEDGTIDYLNLPAVEIGLKFLLSVGIENIHHRVMALTDWLLKGLLSLRHSNGKPLVTIYGPTDTTQRGGTIALNFYDANGKIFDFRLIESLANQHNISLRTGCFCNPGAGELALNISAEDMRAIFEEHDRMTFAQFVEAMTQKGDVEAAGAVRVSVGIATNFADVYRFMHFAQTFVDKKSD